MTLTPLGQLPLPPVEQISHNTFTQHPLELNTNNDPWGDADVYYQSPNCFWVLSKNVSMLYPQSLDMTAMAVELQHSNASLFLAQEMSTAWKPPALLSIHAQCSKVHWHIKLATSSSQDNTDAKYHPGGTLTVALGKWVSQAIGSGMDAVLGQWSYLELMG